MKSITILFISIMIIYLANTSQANGPTSKPISSVKVSIESEEPINPGGTAQFIVKAYSQIDADHFRIWAELPGDMKLISGNLDWNGVVKKDEEYSINFTVFIPEEGTYVIKAGASMQLPGGTAFTDRASFLIGKSIKKSIKGKNVLPRSFIDDRKGVVEYELK